MGESDAMILVDRSTRIMDPASMDPPDDGNGSKCWDIFPLFKIRDQKNQIKKETNKGINDKDLKFRVHNDYIKAYGNIWHYKKKSVNEKFRF